MSAAKQYKHHSVPVWKEGRRNNRHMGLANFFDWKIWVALLYRCKTCHDAHDFVHSLISEPIWRHLYKETRVRQSGCLKFKFDSMSLMTRTVQSVKLIVLLWDVQKILQKKTTRVTTAMSYVISVRENLYNNFSSKNWKKGFKAQNSLGSR